MTARLFTSLVATLLSAGVAGCFGNGYQPLQGYVEGTYVYVSAEAAGRIVERPAEAGRPTGEGAVLFKLDDADELESVTLAEARLAEAEARLANLRVGKRPEELAVLVAELEAARAAFKAANDDYNRKLILLDKNVVAQSLVDTAKAERDSAEARVQSAERQLEVAKLPARPEEIAGAEGNVAAQRAMLSQARIALGRRTIRSPAAGLVEETFYEPGELVAAGQPVVSLLPDANKKIRFFMPEPRLAEVSIGDRIAIACDNCPAALEGEIDFVASDAEFTPPVIYSKDNREKLVFRIEARPLAAAASLKAGQPVDVRLIAESGS
jgi:HlyD family secretion protein